MRDARTAFPLEFRPAVDLFHFAPILRPLYVEAVTQAVFRFPGDEAGRHLQLRHIRPQDAQQVALLDSPAVATVGPFVCHATGNVDDSTAGLTRRSEEHTSELSH